MEEFSKPQYNVDVLKVEVPINAEYVEGSRRLQRAEGLLARRGVEALPRGGGGGHTAVHLSERGREQRAIHRVAGDGVRGGHRFLGRAVRTRHVEGRHSDLRQAGLKALEDWLAKDGVRNIQAVNDALKAAKPWYAKMGVAAPV